MEKEKKEKQDCVFAHVLLMHPKVVMTLNLRKKARYSNIKRPLTTIASVHAREI